MLIENLVLYLSCFTSIGCYWLFIPREKQRHAQVALLFKQLITWFSGLFVAKLI